MGRNRRTVKPSAQPTLVRTQHLPLPAETARDRGILPSRGPLYLVSSCVITGQRMSLCGSGYGHMADGSRPGQAVHRTVCFPGCDGHPVRVAPGQARALTFRGRPDPPTRSRPGPSQVYVRSVKGQQGPGRPEPVGQISLRHLHNPGHAMTPQPDCCDARR
jgi:hypothetical protein